MNTNSKIKLNMDALKTSKEWVRHKVKPGSNIFRILPPFGDSSNGFPYRKWQIIWGLQDPENGRMRPYASSMMTEKRDPVVEFIDELRERLAKMDGDLKARGLDEKSVAKHPKYARLAQFIRDFSPKTTYVYNAVDKSGSVGLLELKSTAHKDMKTKMTEYIQDYNQDPTSLNSEPDDSGVWFNIKRDGEGFKTEYKVEKVQTKERINGQVTFVDDRSALPEIVVENFANLAYDLSNIYKANSYEDLNEVLQANMDRLYEICPEADMSVEVNLDDEDAVPAAKPTPSQPKMAPGFSKVKLQLNDEDDEVVVHPSPMGRKVQPIVDEDDFMKAADDILNG